MSEDRKRRDRERKRAKYVKHPRVYADNVKRRNKTLVRQMKLAAQECHDCRLPITPDTTHRFDFDHRNPREKSFTLSQVRTESVENILNEISKCDVVCKNCHADRTHVQRKDEHISIIREARRSQHTTQQSRLFE